MRDSRRRKHRLAGIKLPLFLSRLAIQRVKKTVLAPDIGDPIHHSWSSIY
jgi:hypothetical protein